MVFGDPPTYEDSHIDLSKKDPLEPNFYDTEDPFEAKEEENNPVRTSISNDFSKAKSAEWDEPPIFNEHEDEERRQGGYGNETTTVNQQYPYSTDMVTLFHLISIFCALLSLVTFLLIEIIPMIMWCFFREHLRRQQPEQAILHYLDIVVTVVVLLIYVFILLFITVLTYGIGAIFFIFLIPFVVVIIELIVSMPKQN